VIVFAVPLWFVVSYVVAPTHRRAYKRSLAFAFVHYIFCSIAEYPFQFPDQVLCSLFSYFLVLRSERLEATPADERSEEPASILTEVRHVRTGSGSKGPGSNYRTATVLVLPQDPLALVSGLGRCPELSQ
jgi:hypothetical protein